MSEIRLASGRRLLVCDVCLTYVDEAAPVTAGWQQLAPGKRGGPDRCPDCAVPRAEGRKWWDEFPSRHAVLLDRPQHRRAARTAEARMTAGFADGDERT